MFYTTSCNTQSSVPEDGQNNCPKQVELTGIINKPLLLHLVGCLYYLYQWCTVKQISDNEMSLLIKYIKSVLWRVAKRLSYIEDARRLKFNMGPPTRRTFVQLFDFMCCRGGNVYSKFGRLYFPDVFLEILVNLVGCLFPSRTIKGTVTYLLHGAASFRSWPVFN